MQRIFFEQDKNWRKGGQVEGGTDEIVCNPFWTNLDNTNFDSPKYKWGDDIDDMVSTVKCSAARDFDSNGIEAINPTITKIKMKLDAPIKFRIGY